MKSLLCLVLTAAIGSGIAQARPDQKSPDARAHPNVTFRVFTGKGRLGVAVLPISGDLRAHFGAPQDRGVLVDRVRTDGPAAKAGLQVGDVVTDVAGKPATSAGDVLDALSDHKKGEAVAIDVIRGAQHVELKATLDDDPVTWSSSSSSSDDWMMPFDGAPDDMRGAIEELRKQMDELRKRFDKRSTTDRDRI
jgi:hypothetical protein